ncbi:related to ketopantoate reductase [Saccharomycodes ludwigii]|uniref:Related to ketopantoate reductase n=1 Tax=Saccharomycodes ludwigii TaxID=36035 RepID=A0A376B4X7_9ASCO|nr:hypothetical protein SCDLUD_000263 [Saccharomycodes ludwigii]KAH3902680.1 hypothetical protein SCDLUD_000263 [Saccharomycodes ludwigii]SSD59745.1 related to ketopantoate reductase [Saccharomycodes ludwigii]
MTYKKPLCLVIGAGGVGVLTAYSLFKADKSRVALVVRSDYEKCLSTGYNIQSCDYGEIKNWKPDLIYRSVEDAAKSGEFFDYIIVTTKNIPDGPSPVYATIKPVIKSNIKNWPSLNSSCSIVLIQNGIDIEHEVIDLLHREGSAKNKFNLLSGVQMIGSIKVGQCEIKHQSKDSVLIGPFDPNDQEAVKKSHEFVKMYDTPENFVTFDHNVRFSRWKKLMYNATINTMTAIVHLDYSRCLEFGKNTTEAGIIRPAMNEIMAIAKSEGYEIDPETATILIEADRDLVYKPSMLVDVEKTQLMELEVIIGNPLKVAKKNNVATPSLKMLYYLLVIIQGRIKEKQGTLIFDENTARVVQ